MHEEIELPGNHAQFLALPVGRISLGVPVREGIIQIGDFSDLPKDRIIVATHPDQTSVVTRADGQPLQVEVVESYDDPAAAPGQRTKVFETPVSSLSIRAGQKPNGGWRWYASGDDLRVPDLRRLDQLVLTIGDYAIRKIVPPGTARPFSDAYRRDRLNH